MRKPTILFSEGALVDFQRSLLRDLNALRPPLSQEITSENLDEMRRHDHIAGQIALIERRPGRWDEMIGFQAGIQAFQAAHQSGFLCTVVTSLRDDEKSGAGFAAWCLSHLRVTVSKLVIYTSDIANYKADAFYHDYYAYCTKWLEVNPQGLAIMPVDRFNRRWLGESLPSGIFPYDNNLDDLTAALAAIAAEFKSAPEAAATA